MKYLVSLFIMLILCIVFAACGSGIGTTFGQAVSQYAEGGPKPKPMDVVLFENGDFSGELGFSVTEYPDDEDMKATTFSAIDGWIAQIDFRTPDGQTFGARVAREGAGDLASLYNEVHDRDVETKTMDGIDVTISHSEAGSTLVQWTRDGFAYAVHVGANNEPPTDAQLEKLVKGVRAAQAQ